MNDDDLIRRGRLAIALRTIASLMRPSPHWTLADAEAVDDAADVLSAIPTATPRPMAEAPQRFAVAVIRTHEGPRGTMKPAPFGNWVRWDDVAHLFPHPESPE